MKLEVLAKELAMHVCRGFQLHDEGDLEKAGHHFGRMYDSLLLDVSRYDAEAAGRAFAEALRIKDVIDANQDRVSRLVDIRWGQTYEQFLCVATLLRLDPRWAYHYNEFWRKHKGEIDYVTDALEAERFFVKRAAGDTSWWEKRSDGRNGIGPLPYLYVVGVEAHDLHTPEAWEMALAIMTQYYLALLRTQAARRNADADKNERIQTPSSKAVSIA